MFLSFFLAGIQFEQDVATCDVLIYFDVPDQIMTDRLIKRGETSGRIDDNEETIAKRLVTFHEQTTPILGYYGKQGKLVTIDANRNPDEVFDDVSQALQGLMEQKQVGKQNQECVVVVVVFLDLLSVSFACFYFQFNKKEIFLFRLILIMRNPVKVYMLFQYPLFSLLFTLITLDVNQFSKIPSFVFPLSLSVRY